MTLPDWLIHAINFIALPVLGWLGLLHNKQSKHATDIAVLQAMANVHKEQQREIIKKLDGIEKALRNKD